MASLEMTIVAPGMTETGKAKSIPRWGTNKLT